MTKTVCWFLILFVAGLLIAGCAEEGGIPGWQALPARMVGNSGCLELKFAGSEDALPDSLSCVEYAYDPAAKILSVRHRNAGFNCCPEKLLCSAGLKGDTLVLREAEKSALCDCMCLYDLTMEVPGIGKGAYTVRVEEPCLREQEPLLFTIDLARVTEGSFCVVRKTYPWGIASL